MNKKVRKHIGQIGMITVIIILTGFGYLINVYGKDSKKEDSFMGYVSIDSKEAKYRIENETGYILVDVRRPDEYSNGHIPEAINIPNETIGTTSDIPELPKKDQRIYVYCRSGARSRQASGKLAAMGYTNIVEMGGVNTWPGNLVK